MDGKASKQTNAFLNIALRLGLLLVMLVTALPAAPVVAAAPVEPQAAAPQPQAVVTLLTLKVVSARTEPNALGGAGVVKGAVISNYKFIINQDNTGDPFQAQKPDCYPYIVDGSGNPTTNPPTANPNYPANCQWPSIRPQQGYVPIFTSGSQANLNQVTGITLPAGKYLISVTADDYKIDGVHITVPMQSSLVTVELQPLPLPTATARVKVFEDVAITNGFFDAPGEQGLAGFRANVADTLGIVSTDVFGNPLCTTYQTDPVTGAYILDADGAPIVDVLGVGCFSDANGDLVVPNLGPNRYGISVIPPDGTDWQLTSTLEGNVDYDTWLQEGSTGFDAEFVNAAEPFPWTIAAFVKPTPGKNLGGTNTITGHVMEAEVYVPYAGGLPYQGSLWGGFGGAKISGPIAEPWLSLNDLLNGDVSVWVGRGLADGSFSIPNVPDGNYTLTYWDTNLFHMLDLVQLTVKGGQVLDMGNIFLSGWFARVTGTVFNDINENGKRDPGEPGLIKYPITVKRRENTVMDRGAIGALTDTNGNYALDNVYPLTSWIVIESYTDNYFTTGYTFQASNQPTETTILGQGVDFSILPVIGQSARLDIGVKAYPIGTNGGIVGTVSYDTTRNELDPRYAFIEAWQPGIPGLTINLYATVKNANGTFVKNADGSYRKGPLLNSAVTEQWQRPKDCTIRDVDGNPVERPAMPPATGGYDCLEAPQSGLQFGTESAAVDGNFGFGTILKNPITGATIPETAIPTGDYLVEVVIPKDSFNRPMYNVTKEEDINVFSGDSYVPQIPPPLCAGPLHTVDVLGVGVDGAAAVSNPTFAANGGSPFEGQQTPLCTVKLVTLTDGKSIAPAFNLFTDVPIPGRWYMYIIDDLNISMNPFEMFFGEKAGIPFSPVGVYDFSGRLVFNAVSDANGVADILMPGTDTISCPSPTGICANVYRLVGNDPGQPGKRNPLYNPLFRTISAQFEIFPGAITPSDLAPTQIGVSIQAPGSQITRVLCKLDDVQPQFFSVDVPYFNANANRSVIIKGFGFGATQGAGTVTLGATTLSVTSWSDRQIVVSIPANSFTPGPYWLSIKANNGLETVNGITLHLRGNGYNPTVFTVGPGRTYATIQSAINAASASPQALVVVFPDTVTATNPSGTYFENLVIHTPIKLQGIGPGGVYADSTGVLGSNISGLGFGGDTVLADAWRTLVTNLQTSPGWDGNQQVYEGQVIYFVAKDGVFGSNYKASVDGFVIEGGDQMGFPNNINQIGGGQNGAPPAVVNQGGGIFANAYVRYLTISNNIFQSNGGSYGGAIRIGTPHLAGPDTSSHNDSVRIMHNRLIANGGTNLAGGAGIFQGTNNYEIAYNDICGNFSAEYGGGISVYGYSPFGQIHNNRIYFNRSYDEGGGVMIAGELPANPSLLTQGAGPQSIFSNVIQSNLSNDDGGGLRFLMAGNYIMKVENNFIVNNISTHEGGGIALLDTPNVRIVNNTIMKNITTATAATSNGLPAPAGLSTDLNSSALQVTLPTGSPVFSKPVLFNNIFADNRAGTWTGGGVAGIGLPGDPNPIRLWDMGVADGSGLLNPTNTLMNVTDGTVASPTNLVIADPQVISTYDTTIQVMPWRTNPNLIGAIMVAVEVPPNMMGNYHLQGTSPAINAGAASKTLLIQMVSTLVTAPGMDIDGQGRPSGGGFEIGADEIAGGAAPDVMPFMTFIPQVLY